MSVPKGTPFIMGKQHVLTTLLQVVDLYEVSSSYDKYGLPCVEQLPFICNECQLLKLFCTKKKKHLDPSVLNPTCQKQKREKKKAALSRDIGAFLYFFFHLYGVGYFVCLGEEGGRVTGQVRPF